MYISGTLLFKNPGKIKRLVTSTPTVDEEILVLLGRFKTGHQYHHYLLQGDSP